jgi:hypothetical protein
MQKRIQKLILTINAHSKKSYLLVLVITSPEAISLKPIKDVTGPGLVEAAPRPCYFHGLGLFSLRNILLTKQAKPG